MSGWLRRWSQRQRDHTWGIDADLVRDNRRRFKFAFGLMGLGLLFILFGGKLFSPDPLRWIVLGTAGVSFLAGFSMGMWAQQEAAFLSKPEREEPPTIFKR
jgi:hypothetical protein